MYWRHLFKCIFMQFHRKFFCPLETTQRDAKYSCSLVLSALSMRLGYSTNSVFLPMPPFKRTENNAADNVNITLVPD